MHQTRKEIKDKKIVAIIRGNYQAEQVLEIVNVLQQNHISVMEVTLNTPGALAAISQVRKEFTSVTIGAGTVRNVNDFRKAVDAGAQFTVAPNLCLETLKESLTSNILHLPGVLTPTEAQTAANHGALLLKLFPAEFGGINYLKAIKAPLDDLDFVPTGGVTPENIAAFIQAGAAAVGIGSSLVGKGISLEDLAIKAKSFYQALNGNK